MTRPLNGNAIEPAHGLAARVASALVEYVPASADPLLEVARRWVRPLVSPFLRVELRRGATRAGQDAGLLLVGRGMLLEYLSRRFFMDDPAREPKPPIALHRLRDSLPRAIGTADLALALVPRVVAARAAGNFLLRVPAYVDFLMSTGETGGLEAASQTLRADARAIRRSELVGRVSHDPAEFERFYIHFHLPMVDDRHGDLGVRHGIRVLRRRFRFGGILWIELERVPLAGILFEVRGATMNLLVGGRRSTGDARLDAQASLATYLLSMDLARERGCVSVNLGGAVPVLTDGLFRHKRAWGARVAPRAETHNELLCGWLKPGPAVLGFLADAPLLYRSGRSLAAVAAIASDQPVDPRKAARLRQSLVANGIDDLTVMAPGGWVAPERGWTLPPADALRLRRPLSSAELIAERAL